MVDLGGCHMKKGLRKFVFKGIMCSASTLILVLGMHVVSHAADTVPNGFSEVPISNVQYPSTTNYQRYYWMSGRDKPSYDFTQPPKDSYNNGRFDVSKVYANYVRNGKLTAATTKMYVVMGSAPNYLAYDQGANYFVSSTYMNLFKYTGTYPRGNGAPAATDKSTDDILASSQNSNSSMVDPGFSSTNMIPVNYFNGKKLSDNNKVKPEGASFTAGQYYLITNGGSPLIGSYSGSVQLGSLIVDSGQGRDLASTYAMFNVGSDTAPTQLKPTVTQAYSYDKNLTGKGTQVGDTITISKGSQKLGTATVNADLTWTYTLQSPAQANEQYTVTETSPIPGDKPGTANMTVQKSTNLTLNVYPTVAWGRTIKGDGAIPGSKLTIGYVQYANQKATVNADGTWSIVIADTNKESLQFGVTYPISITGPDGSTGTANVKPFGLTAGSMSPMDFGSYDLSKLNYTTLYPLSSWGGLKFNGDISGKTNPWVLNIQASSFTDNMPIRIWYGDSNNKQQVTTSGIRFLQDSNNNVITTTNGSSTINFPTGKNMYLDFSGAKGTLRQKTYSSNLTVSIQNVINS